MKLDELIGDTLRNDAQRLNLHGAGYEATRRRATRRKHRGQAGVAAISVAAVTGGAIAVVNNNGARSTVSIGSGRGADASNIKAKPLHFSWRKTDAVAPVDYGGLPSQVVGSDGTLYLTAEAPGVGVDSPQHVVYSSKNGSPWTAGAVDPLRPWYGDLAEQSGVLYALTTAPNGASGLKAELGTSVDSGKSWTRSTIDGAIKAPSVQLGLDAPLVRERVAVLGDTQVVAVTGVYSAYPTVQRKVKRLGIKADSWAFVSTPEGFEARDRTHCTNSQSSSICRGNLVATVTWADLGVPPNFDFEITKVFVRVSRGPWKLVSGLPPAIDSVGATSEGFVAVLSQKRAAFLSVDGTSVKSMLWRSRDGQHWAQDEHFPFSQSASRISGDRMTGWTKAGYSVSNDAGRSWSVLDFTKILGLSKRDGFDIRGSGLGPLGFVYLVEATATHVEWLVLSRDGHAWAAASAPQLGVPKGGVVSTIRVGTDHIEVEYQDAPRKTDHDRIISNATLIGTPIR